MIKHLAGAIVSGYDETFLNAFVPNYWEVWSLPWSPGLRWIWPVGVCACLGSPEHSRGGCKAQLAFYLHSQWSVEACYALWEGKRTLLRCSFLLSPPPPLLWWPLGISDVFFLFSTLFFSSFPFCFSLSVRVCACVLSHFLDHFCVFYYFSVPQAAATR